MNEVAPQQMFQSTIEHIREDEKTDLFSKIVTLWLKARFVAVIKWYHVSE